jgi:predicted AlkP superfamily phosphohydrolase/phosphomutase
MRFLRFFPAILLILAVCQPGCGRPGGALKRPRPAVVLLGLDGASWELIDPLIASGRLPLFKQLKETAAWGTLRTSTPAKSPIIWTSIATGKTSAKHGIDDFRSKKRNARGKFPIYNSLDIREPLLWEMLGRQGRRSVLVNWYLSFPPQPLQGVNVSDYFSVSAFSRSANRTLALRQSVFPPERAPEIEKWIDSDYARVLKKLNIPDYPALYEKRGTGMRFNDFPIFKEFPDMALQEGVVAETATRLFRSEDFDLFAAYFELTDVVQHFAYMSLVDDDFKLTLDRAWGQNGIPVALESEAYARIAEILCPVYQNLERIIGDLIAASAERETYFLILSDHGFSFFFRDGTVRYNHVGPDKAPDGILIVHGPGVKPGKIKLARIYDIAPTVLYLLGLPLDRQMDGAPLRRLFTFKHESGYTVYKKGKTRSGGRDSEAEEKKLQELKALGYIN